MLKNVITWLPYIDANSLETQFYVVEEDLSIHVPEKKTIYEDIYTDAKKETWENPFFVF